MKTINDWAPEVRSLLTRLTGAGFALVKADNGEDTLAFSGDNLEAFIATLIACDEARLYVKWPDGRMRWLFLVLGNSPGEIVADYSLPAWHGPKDDALNDLLDDHYEEWADRAQPTKQIED